MTSRRQIAANRRNARLSTGPRTSEGRAASSANATRHGILSNRFIPPHEDRDLFNELLEELLDEFGPDSALELMLVERLAILFWRERRLAAAEAEQVQQQFEAARNAFNDSRAQNVSIGEQYLVGRYQGMLGRQIRDTLRDLEDAYERRLQLIEPMQSDGEADEERPTLDEQN